ncbi:MAG: DNA primase [Actinomycetota bacterium]|nr:MAG: DNA primase [Actinomycetota bacterium]
MTGRIREDDIAAVREGARIDEVIREHVTLRPAGGGSLKGLCPFHEERSPSFNVNPAKGVYYCFGCGEGGDVVAFVQKVDHLSFAEAIEKLAGRAGVVLRYVEGGSAARPAQGQRTRLVEAHRQAAAFYVERLASPEAEIGRRFLTDRGFDAAAAARFGVGFAPRSWDAATSFLRGKGFTDTELKAAGLVAEGGRGVYDRFRGRLVWPIRELSGDIVGFGARKLFDDDDGPKYLNTPETPIYKKSQVLYGIDLARKDIANQQRAVVVEGYTDVMACHLAGVPTAVATCGTAFGAEHVRVLRRLLMDDEHLRGEVVFTFDGDAAGQRAALRAFAEDQRFVAATFVAVEPTGLDPCDLRLARGDAAVRDLIDRRVPLFRFAIQSTLARFDLDTAEGRVAALRAVAPVVAGIRDAALRSEYVRTVAGWLGVDVTGVAAEVGAAGRATAGRRGTSATPPAGTAPTGASPTGTAPTGASPAGAAPATRPAVPPAADPRRGAGDPAVRVEREALKCVLAEPALCAGWFEAIDPGAFTAPAYAAVYQAIAAAGGPAAGLSGIGWLDAVLTACPDDGVRALVRALAVEPPPTQHGVDERYATSILARLLELDAGRRIAELKARLQRADPTAEADDANRLFADLLALEQYRRELRERATGAQL